MICSIVLAHYGPTHLARLMRTLTSDGDSVVLHLDQRVDRAPFADSIGQPGVTLVQDAVSVVWGGWSMVEATLRSLRLAISVAPDATHYQLMSGDSYPLVPMREMRAVYERAGDANHLDMDPFPQPHKPAPRIRNYYIEHDPWTNRWSVVLRGLHRLMRRPQGALQGRTLWAGEQWWTLTAATARWLLRAVDDDPRFVRFMRHTRIPDEHFVHILLGNSPYSATLRPPLFYADWRPGPDGRLPPILNAQHVAELRGGPYVWARKFPPDDGSIAELVEANWSSDYPASGR